jgi:glycosyltransferase involved in cell wall biosynthesis
MTTEPTTSPSPIPTDPSGGGPLVSVLVAAYNEEDTVESVVRRVAELPFRSEIVVVDDGSVDGTRALLEELERSGDIVVIQDADLEYDPRDLPRLLGPILEGHADVVFGTRLRGGQPQRAHLFWHYAGNRFLSLLTNVLFNTTISDMEVGYKAFRGDLVRSLDLVSDDFAIEPELAAKILRQREVRLYEVPVSYFGRTYAEGKKITWRDGIGAVRALFRFRLER